MYENEQRSLKIAQISHLEFDDIEYGQGYEASPYLYFFVELSNEDEKVDILNFYEAIDKKYIKHDLGIYDDVTDITHKLYNCLLCDWSQKLLRFHFDYREVVYLKEEDASNIKIYNRDRKLKSIGI